MQREGAGVCVAWGRGYCSYLKPTGVARTLRFLRYGPTPDGAFGTDTVMEMGAQGAFPHRFPALRVLFCRRPRSYRVIYVNAI